jgi:hypothetical protein
MVKKIAGRNKLNVIDSLPYSQLIFLVASGKNYALSIAEARGKKDSSPTAKQLKQLKEKGFLKSRKEPRLNKTIYSVNWEKIIKEFIKALQEHKEDVLKQDEFLRTNLKEAFKKSFNYLDYLENKEFIKSIKQNNYLIEYLKVYFSDISKTSLNYSIANALSYILFFADFNFLTSVSRNIQKISYFLEQQKRKIIPKNLIGMSEEKWKEVDMKQWNKNLKETFSENLKNVFDTAQERTNEIAQKDKELTELAILNNIFQVLKVELTLQVSLNQTLEKVSDIIIKKHFTEEEYQRLRQMDWEKRRPKTEEEYRNSSKTTKPTENTEEKSGNTDKKEPLSSENKEGETQK